MSRYRRSGALDDVVLTGGDGGFVGIDQRVSPSQLSAGMLEVSENGRIDGSWVPRRGASTLKGLSVGTDRPLKVPFLLTSASAVNLSWSAGVATLFVIGGHGLVVGDEAWLELRDVTFTGEDPNNVHWMTVASWDTLSFEMGDPGTVSTGNIGAWLDDEKAVEVWGSCEYSDPNTVGADYIFIAANNGAEKVSLSDGSSEFIDYPGLSSLTERCAMLQAFDKVYLWREGETPWVWTSGDSAFVEVPSGPKTQHSVFDGTDNVVVSGGVATVTYADHGLSVDDVIYIVGATADGQGNTTEAVDGVYGTAVRVFEVPDADTFRYYTNAGDDTYSVVFSTGASRLGGGFIHMPAAAWGVYHQRRFWLPYTYDAESPPVSRGIRDEIIASLILDPDTFDPLGDQYRITGGTADEVVALQPFFEDRLLIFNRNSIHYISGVSGSLIDTATKELTRELGCVARQSVASHGPAVFFLSDRGVYSVSFFDEYNLRGADEPLSEPIQPIIDRINRDLASESVGLFFDNRYFLAVPLDSSAGLGDALGNNAILVYNTLESAWESIDFVDDPRFLILDLILGRGDELNSMFVVSKQGGIHKWNDLDTDADQVVLTPDEPEESVPVAWSLKSRGYTLDTLDRKRFTRLQVQCRSGDGASNMEIMFSSEDPDQSVSVGDFYTLLGSPLPGNESATVRARVGGLRGLYGQIEIQGRQGRPEIISLTTNATITNRATISAQ